MRPGLSPWRCGNSESPSFSWGGFTPKNVVIFICGLTGTISGTILPLIDRAFIPDFKRIREALGVPADAKDSVFYEQYDTEPVIDIKNPAVVEPLKAELHAALSKYGLA